jgi:hypothetical protein
VARAIEMATAREPGVGVNQVLDSLAGDLSGLSCLTGYPPGLLQSGPGFFQWGGHHSSSAFSNTGLTPSVTTGPPS